VFDIITKSTIQIMKPNDSDLIKIFVLTFILIS